MKALSVKLKGFSCFQDGWAGFDSFAPITVIIGRNNTGKSRMLDMVETLTKESIAKTGFEASCSAVLDEDFLASLFSKTTSGGELSPSTSGFYAKYSHWNHTGSRYIESKVEWSLNPQGNVDAINIAPPAELQHNYRIAADDVIRNHLGQIGCPLSRKAFRRIVADRDIRSESASNTFNLKPNGDGATNIIRRHITSSSLSADLIQVDLLTALDDIFGHDGTFQRIEIRHHDESGDDVWEVYLGEPHKGLVSLSNSGSGLKTVIIVLLNLIVIPRIDRLENSEYVFAFEELENNLHPALLRRLLKYVAEYVSRENCYLFLTTHSNVALDFFGTRGDTQIVHVTHNGKSAAAKTIATHFDHVGLLTELGSRPSDLLQANGVVWLDGPSDRIYFNRFIELFSDGELREGRDYQCAFYGGSNLANTTFSAPDESDSTFANLLRLNHNIAVICDGDRTAATGAGSRIKGRVQRIKQEVDQIPSAFLWITDTKEIENYIPGSVWANVYEVKSVPDPEKYDSFPSSNLKENDFVPKNLNRMSFDKCEFAMKAVSYLTCDCLASRFEIESTMTSLVDQIKKWNK